MAQISSCISPLQLKFHSSEVSCFNRRQFDKVEIGPDIWAYLTRRRRSSPSGVLRVVTRCMRSGSEIGDDRRETPKTRFLTVEGFKGMVGDLPPYFGRLKKQISTNGSIGFGIIIAVVIVAIRELVANRQRVKNHGSVEDLVRRGQLKYNRRGISSPLQYDDPFDNPVVKVNMDNSSVVMCGKMYRLSPVTLSEEQQEVHKKRRMRAYQWKRPTVFLKEGETIPEDVDPDSIRWIPANHPFASTNSDIDESSAQKNVYQKSGVPSRIRAEHEALQRKLEALQQVQKSDKISRDINLNRNADGLSESAPSIQDTLPPRPTNYDKYQHDDPRPKSAAC